MDGWETTVETPLGTYSSPPEHSREEFLALLNVVLGEQRGDLRTATVTHRREGEEPVVRTIRMDRLASHD